MEKIRKGWYKHFKGGVYEVFGTGMHTETEEVLVFYRHVTEQNPDGYWARPVSMFLDEKELEDGTKVRRFEFLSEEKPEVG